MEAITSRRDPRVRELLALSRTRVRRERGRHLVEGPHAVGEALRAGVVEEIYLLAGTGLDDGVAVPDEVPVVELAHHVLEHLTDAVTPQGVLALARSRTVPLASVVGHGLLVVLERLADPGNLGAIVRVADAAGADAVVVGAGSADPFSPKAVRGAAGSTYHLPVVVGVEPDEVVAACHAAGQRVLGLAGEAERSVFDVDTGAPLAIVLGSEAHGLAASTREVVDDLVAIPIHGRAESLNVATAAAVACYALRPRTAGP